MGPGTLTGVNVTGNPPKLKSISFERLVKAAPIGVCAEFSPKLQHVTAGLVLILPKD
jgi:hypothetical protein